MKNYFPNKNKVYLQNNRTNVFPLGNMWSTFAVDLQSNLGALRIYPRLKLNVSNTTLTNMSSPVVKFKYFDTQMFAIGGTRMFKASAPFTSNAFVQDASTSSPNDFSLASDMEVVPDDTLTSPVLVVSTKDELLKKASDGAGTGAFFSIGSLLNNTNHKIAYFKRFNRTYILNDIDSVVSCDSALASINTTGDYTLQLNSAASAESINALTSIVTSSNFVWLGSISIANADQANRGFLIQWDGISAQPTALFPVNAHGIVGIIIGDDDVPYAMDTNGILQKFTGTGLQEVGRLPVQSGKNLLNAGQSVTGQFMDANGMCFTKNGTIRANVSNVNEDGSINENFAGGVYEFDLKGNCTSLALPSMNPISSSTITDFGQNMIEAVGAIINTDNLNIASAQQSQLLVGSGFRDASLNLKYGIFVDNFQDDVQKKGYFVIDWFESNEIAESWNVWWASFRRFLNVNDNIVFKYRNFEEDYTGGIIAWTSTTTFTILNSSVNVGNYWTAEMGTGGEVEITGGPGSGACVHIINAVLAAGTWTVTIDEAVTGVTGSSYARFQKWIKVFPSNALNSISTWEQWAINTLSTPRIQIKGCFTYTGQGEYYKGILTSNPDIISD